MSEPTQKYRDKDVVNILTKKIKNLADKTSETVRIMHVCGTHEHDLVKAGLRSLLPKNIDLIAGKKGKLGIISKTNFVWYNSK